MLAGGGALPKKGRRIEAKRMNVRNLGIEFRRSHGASVEMGPRTDRASEGRDRSLASKFEGRGSVSTRRVLGENDGTNFYKT